MLICRPIVITIGHCQLHFVCVFERVYTCLLCVVPILMSNPILVSHIQKLDTLDFNPGNVPHNGNPNRSQGSDATRVRNHGNETHITSPFPLPYRTPICSTIALGPWKICGIHPSGVRTSGWEDGGVGGSGDGKEVINWSFVGVFNYVASRRVAVYRWNEPSGWPSDYCSSLSTMRNILAYVTYT